MRRTVLSIFLLLTIQLVCNSANRYAVANGNWNETSTWSATSGGASGASVPIAGDNVYINNNYTVIVNVNTASLTLLSISSGSTLSVSANYTVTSTTITVDGTYINNSTGAITATTKTINGTYRHNANCNLTTFTWNSTATLSIGAACAGSCYLAQTPITIAAYTQDGGTFNLGGGTSRTINAGTFTQTGGTITSGVNCSLNITNSGSQSSGGVIGGNLAVTKSGAGTLTLAGTNTYTGTTTITAGTLVLQDQYASPSFAIASGAILELQRTSDLVYTTSTLFTGAGTLKKTGSGLIEWGAAVATFALSAGSLIDVQAGIFKAGSWYNEDWTNNLSSLTVASGASFWGMESNIKVDALNGSGTIESGFSNPEYLNFTFGVNGGDGTFSGVLANQYFSGNYYTGNFVKVGSGTQTLNGANTYTGTTTVLAGTLRAGNNSALGTAAAGTTISAGATFDINGYTLGTEAFVLSGGTIVNNGAGNIQAIQKLTVTAHSFIGGSGRWDVRNNGLADAGVTVNSGITLTKQDANMIFFVNVPIVNNGTIIVDNSYLFLENNCATSGTGTYTVNSAGILGLVAYGAGITLNNNVTIQNGGTLFSDNSSGGSSTIAGDISIAGTISIFNSVTFTISGVISGTGAITKTGAGDLTVSGTNTYSGGTTISNGILQIGNNGTTGSIVGNVVNNAALQFRRTNTYTYAGIISGSGTVAIGGGGTTTGTVIFTGNNTCSGETTIYTGMTLQVGDNTVTGTIGGNIVNYGTLVFYRSNEYSYDYVISGTGNLIKNGDGEFTLSNANSYTGTTTVISQRLNYYITANGGSNSGIGASSNSAANVIIDGGHLRYTGTGGSTDRLFTLTANGGRVYSSGSGTHSWTNTGDIIIEGSGDRLLEIGGGTATTTYFAPRLPNPSSGVLSITKTGNNNIWVFTADHTYTGNTTITNGTIQLGNNTTTGSVAGNIINNATLIFNRSNAIEYSNVISGSGTLYQNGSARLNIRGTQTYTGATIINAGELELGGLGAPSSTRQLAIGNIVTVNTNGTLIVSGLGGSADNNEIIGGLQGDGTILTYNAATVARLTINNTADYTFSGQIIGNARLQIIKTGTGTFTLSGNNAYDGPTTISQGVLKIGSATALGSITGNTTILSGSALDLNGITYSNIETVTIEGTGVSSGGAIFNSSSTTAVFPATITLSGASTITANNQITLSGTIGPATQNLTKAGTSSLIFTNNTISLQDLHISAGTLNGGTSIINIYRNFTSSGTYNPSTNGVNMLGSTIQTIPAIPFNNLTINNNAGVILSGNISISGTLTLTNGKLNTDAYSIDLGTTGTLIESPINPTSYITGTIKATRDLITSVNNTFGGIGIEITEQNTTNNTTEVIRVTGTGCVAAGNTGILRYFTIDPLTDIGLNATMKFHYYNHEIAGHDESNLLIYKSIDGRLTWSGFTPNSSDVDNNFMVLSGIASFSDWTASDGIDSPLPIQLVDFDAFATDNSIEIQWTTASETNNDFFTVERSFDGINWVKIKTIPGAGNSIVMQEYAIYDYELILGYVVYYRLKQTDYDGTHSYSKVISVHLNSENDTSIHIRYTNYEILIECSEKTQQTIDFIELISISGKVVYKSHVFTPRIQTAGIARGVYYVYCKQKQMHTAVKVIID